tara:strand:- start:857 stop:1282 length:426 start_codon:yes stop_codon:yes gene_type:complete
MTRLMIPRTPAIMSSRAFDQFFESFFSDPTPWVKNSTEGYPLTDIFKNDNDEQVIQMALAGFDKDDINIAVDNNRITISASNIEESEANTRRIARRAFSKTFVDHQGELNLSKADASFTNGLLTVAIPQAVVTKKQIIEIK